MSDSLAELTGPLTGWAAAEAESLLVLLPDRWVHTQEVAANARWASVGVRPDDRDLLIAAAYLHDIGYSETLLDSGFHPLDGALHLRRQGLGELACLVAHHTGARFEAGDRGLVGQLAAFSRPAGPIADALTYSDVTTGPAGQAQDGGERFEEIVDRHGSDSVMTTHGRADARAEMHGMVARTLRRTARRRPVTGALTVTPITLGCTTLVRFQGVLDELTAPHAISALRAVLNHRPHAVLVDLALLTGLDDTGARTLINASHERIPITLIDPRGRDRTVLTAIQPGGWPPQIVYGIEAALIPHCGT